MISSSVASAMASMEPNLATSASLTTFPTCWIPRAKRILSWEAVERDLRMPSVTRIARFDCHPGREDSRAGSRRRTSGMPFGRSPLVTSCSRVPAIGEKGEERKAE